MTAEAPVAHTTGPLLLLSREVNVSDAVRKDGGQRLSELVKHTSLFVSGLGEISSARRRRLEGHTNICQVLPCYVAFSQRMACIKSKIESGGKARGAC